MKASVDDVFGARFLEARRAAGLSQEAIVERVEREGVRLHVTAIGKIERGERRVTVGEAVALAKCFGMTVDELAGVGGPMVAPLAMLREARATFQSGIGAYYRALSEFAKAVDINAVGVADGEWSRLERFAEVLTPARVVALWFIGRLGDDLAARDVETDLGIGAWLSSIDNRDRMVIIESVGGIESAAELVRRDLG